MLAAREEIVALDDGARLWTATEGEGGPVVLCHGGPGGTDTLAPLAAMIADLARVHRYGGCRTKDVAAPRVGALTASMR